MAKKKLPRKGESEATGWERTGKDTFDVKHSDGSVFQCTVDDPAKFNAFKGLKNNSPRIGGFAGIGDKKELICDICKQRVYKVTYKDKQYFCTKCI